MLKIDRLLSIIIYLLNHKLVSAGTLAERYGVSIRTIQRDMLTIDAAGVPVISIQGPHGGYGIMETYKFDSRLVSVEDLYYIITALKSVSVTLPDARLNHTLEKVKGLMPTGRPELIADRDSKLSIDFSLLGGDPRRHAAFETVMEAVDSERLLQFSYTSNKLVTTVRTVEPMTVAFSWRSWYLYAWCRMRQDFRLFRISRIRDPMMLPERFARRKVSFEEFQRRQSSGPLTELTLKFRPAMRAIAEELYAEEACSETGDGGLIVRTSLPEDGWMYGFILSFGEFVTVLDPPHVQKALGASAAAVARKYSEVPEKP